jgi:hypothetical protein
MKMTNASSYNFAAFITAVKSVKIQAPEVDYFIFDVITDSEKVS